MIHEARDGGCRATGGVGSGCRPSTSTSGDSSEPAPSNRFATARVPPTLPLPRLVLTQTEQGVIGVPLGWRVHAEWLANAQQSRFLLFPPRPRLELVVVQAVPLSSFHDETVDEWLHRFVRLNAWVAEMPTVRTVVQDDGCPPDARCMESESTADRVVSCAVIVDGLVVVAFMFEIEPKRFARLGGYRALATIAAAGGGIRP